MGRPSGLSHWFRPFPKLSNTKHCVRNHTLFFGSLGSGRIYKSKNRLLFKKTVQHKSSRKPSPGLHEKILSDTNIFSIEGSGISAETPRTFVLARYPWGSGIPFRRIGRDFVLQCIDSILGQSCILWASPLSFVLRCKQRNPSSSFIFHGAL